MVRVQFRARNDSMHPTAPLPDTIVRNGIATAALLRPRDDIMERRYQRRPGDPVATGRHTHYL
jgi:hypothetical protein